MRWFTVPLAALVLAAAALPAEAAMTKPLTYALYDSSCGEEVAAPHARRIYVAMTGGRVEVQARGGIPSMNYAGPADERFLGELAAFFRSVDPGAWPGATKGRPGWAKDRCTWRVLARGEGRETLLDATGSDAAQPGPRTGDEARLFALLRTHVPRLQREMPKSLASLEFSFTGPYRRYSLEVREENGLVSARSPAANGRRSFYADPALAVEFEKILASRSAEQWHGHGGDASREREFGFAARYSTRQEITASGQLAAAPAGLPEAMELIARRLDEEARRHEALLAKSPRHVTEFTFSESGSMVAPYWIYYERLDRGGLQPYLRCVLGGRVLGEARVSPGQRDRIEQWVESVRAWNGFRGSDPRVMDGYGFSVNASFSDRTDPVTASGSNKFPEGYHAKRDELRRIFSGILPADSLREAR